MMNRRLKNEIELVKSELTASTVIEWMTQLEHSCKKTLDSFICWSDGIDWDKNAISIVKRETLENTMYFDAKLNCWLDK